MFYDNLNSILIERKMKLSNVCMKIGLSKAAGSSWKKGSLPRTEQLIALSNYLQVSIDFLIFGIEDQEDEREPQLLNEFRNLREEDKSLVMDMIKTIKKNEIHHNS